MLAAARSAPVAARLSTAAETSPYSLSSPHAPASATCGPMHQAECQHTAPLLAPAQAGRQALASSPLLLTAYGCTTEASTHTGSG